MTERRVTEIEAALRATKGDPEFAMRWLQQQPDIRLMACAPEQHPELTGPDSPVELAMFAIPGGLMVYMPHAPPDLVGDWLDRIERSLGGQVH